MEDTERYRVTEIAGAMKFEPPTYRLTTRMVRGRWWGRRRREHSLECIQTGTVLSGLSDEDLQYARAWMPVVPT